MSWFFKGKPVTEELIGDYHSFVYVITNEINGRKYIGKKQLNFTRRKAVKGRMRKKKVTLPSDWESYYGSNKELNEDVKKHGEENFHREIIRFCTSKSEASYYEAKLQFDSNALLTDQYYNSWIAVKVHKNKTLT